MNVNVAELLQDMAERTRQNKDAARELLMQPGAALNWRVDPQSWSVLECVEHLNLYGDFYLPEIERVSSKSTYASEPVFKSGILGNYFAEMMLPRPGFKKIKTFKDKNPLGSELEKTSIEKFILQQDKLTALLEKASHVSLNRTKAAISLSKYVKLKLGDILRVVVYHNQRHLKQAKRVLEQMNTEEH
ncbi:DinB family protein [soil metagenome]